MRTLPPVAPEDNHLLDSFARAALAGLLASPSAEASAVASEPEQMAILAWDYAEAMLNERKRRFPTLPADGV